MWYHLILSDITYNQDDITLKLDDIILRRGDITLNRGDITSKARWYHILLINSKTAPHTFAHRQTWSYTAEINMHMSCMIINLFWFLKLYCGFKYTRLCMINHILGLKQHNYRWMVMLGFIRKGSANLKGRESSEKFKMKIYVSTGYGTSEPLRSSRTPSPFGHRDSWLFVF